jgi:hypothetical protein
MVRAVETAPTHSEVRTPGPLIMHRPMNSCYPRPRISVLTGVPRMRPSAYLCGYTMYGGSISGPWVFEVDDSVGVSWPYARFCIWTLENNPSAHLGIQGNRRGRTEASSPEPVSTFPSQHLGMLYVRPTTWDP